MQRELQRETGSPEARKPRPIVRGGVSAGRAGVDLLGRRGQGRGRTADLPLFRRTLVPTELPGRARLMLPVPRDRAGVTCRKPGRRADHARRRGLAVLTGLEPATSALTGRRALQLLHRTLLVMPCPQRDSNPCYRLERAASWAARRWGRPCHHRTMALIAACTHRTRPEA